MRSFYIVLVLLLLAGGVSAPAQDLYVSPAGNDAAAGTAANPLQTVSAARDLLRTRRSAGTLAPGPVTVWLGSGYYDLAGTLTLDARDSGSATAPVTFAGLTGQSAHLTGAIRLDPTWFGLVTSTADVWPRLDPAARGQVYVADLSAHGISNLGTLKPRGFGLSAPAPMELSINGSVLVLGQWPNAKQPMVSTVGVSAPATITYAGTRASRWTTAKDAWAHGLWSQNWADFHLPISSINPGGSALTFAYPPAQYGFAANQPYYVYNLLEEIDQAGEYYIDRAAGKVYVWPAGPLVGATIQASVLETPLLQVNGANYITWRNIIFESGRGALVDVEGGDHIRLDSCLLRNAGQAAVNITGASSGLDQCEVVDCGEEGVLLHGGNRAALTSTGNYVTNTRLARVGRISWAYKPGVSLESGCGNIVSHNLFDDMPHAAIIFSGNNHTIVGNEIQRVCATTGDAGAIYTSRGWATRGTAVNNNYIHHLAANLAGGVHGIYLDDCASGIQVQGNVIYRIANTAIFCGGGRDNSMTNNIIALAAVGHYNDERGVQRINNNPGDYWNLRERLGDDGVNYQANPWAVAFPACAAIPNDWTLIQKGLWRNPQGCVFSTNAGWGNSVWTQQYDSSGTGVFAWYAALTGNESASATLFSESAAVDRTLRAAGLTATPAGFLAVPFNSIGPAVSGVGTTLAPGGGTLSGKSNGSSMIDLAWTDSGHLGADRPSGWELQQQNTSTLAWQAVGSYGPDVRFTELAGLAANTLYTFRLRSYNAGGSTISNLLSVSTGASAPVVGTATRVEAEDYYTVVNDVGGNGRVTIADGNLDSGRSVCLYDVGDSFRLPFQVPSIGSYQVSVRVRSGGSTGPTVFWPNGYQFFIDGAPVILVGDTTSLSALDSAYGGCYWGTMTVSGLPLSAGAHVLQIAAATSWGVVDYMEFAPLGSSLPVVPTLRVPSDIVAEATSGAGAPVSFGATAADGAGTPLAVVSAPVSGSIFPLGSTVVNVSATDGAGNVVRGKFNVTVKDTTPPVLVVPLNLVVEAGSPAGQVVAFAASATDLVSGTVTVTSTPAAGGTFGLGTTTVTSVAVDAAGNRASAQFSVTVKDTTPPVITVPATLTITTNDSSGATVSFSPSAMDAVSGPVTVTCSPASGSRFSLGNTTVQVSATDGAGNAATKSFAIVVQLIPLSAPTGVIAALQGNSVTLHWDAMENDNTYTVQRAVAGGGYIVIGHGLTQNFITDAAVLPGTIYNYVVSRTSGGQTSGFSVPAQVATPAAAGGLDSVDIGDVGVAGSSALSGGCYTISGSGVDIWDNNDSFHYDSGVATGDARITVRVVALDDTNGWAKAGIMFRDSLAPDASFVNLCLTPENGAIFQWRNGSGNYCGSTASTWAGAPVWLRLVRSGNNFTAYRSADGYVWAWMGTVQVPLATVARAGIALTSHARGQECHASFDSFALVAGDPAAGNRIEAESRYQVLADVGGNGSVGVSDGQLDSGQSVRLYDSGDKIRLPFSVQNGGLYIIKAQVRSGGTSGSAGFWPGGYLFAVDGSAQSFTGVAATISAFDSSYGGCFWGTMTSAAVTLAAGQHYCDIAANANWGVVDFIQVEPAGP